MSDSVQTLLEDGLKELKLSVESEPLLNFLALLSKWNKAYNLTAIRSLPEMVTKHILDSLAILPYLHGDTLLDIGSGAGLPGIPLAIACQNKQFVLLDSNGKKTRFMQTVRRELGLKNIEIVQSRVESYHPSQTFATVMSRAFANLKQMIALSEHLVSEEGIWLAMKGHVPTAELAEITEPWQVHSYKVPDLDSERCVIVINHSSRNESWLK